MPHAIHYGRIKSVVLGRVPSTTERRRDAPKLEPRNLLVSLQEPLASDVKSRNTCMQCMLGHRHSCGILLKLMKTSNTKKKHFAAIEISTRVLYMVNQYFTTASRWTCSCTGCKKVLVWVYCHAIYSCTITSMTKIINTDGRTWTGGPAGAAQVFPVRSDFSHRNAPPFSTAHKAEEPLQLQQQE